MFDEIIIVLMTLIARNAIDPTLFRATAILPYIH